MLEAARKVISECVRCLSRFFQLSVIIANFQSSPADSFIVPAPGASPSLHVYASIQGMPALSSRPR
jgi:hypothetical protein